jgi:predicted nucleic acid-binding protein
VSYLVDTNAISELRRKTPHRGVLQWFEQRPARAMYLSVLSLGEIRKGVERLEDPSRRAALMDWLELELPAFFQERLLAVDRVVADHWGRLLAAAARPLPAIDSLIAATALAHGLTLVTRNVRDFEGIGVPLIDPWSAA